MIETNSFVERARSIDLSWYAGVPCSMLGPLIDAVADDESLTYVGAANEGDAVAMAAGAFLGGRRGAALMQNSGLGNAVSPLSSLTHPFRIPMLLLVTLRGDPAHPDEPQHALMGEMTGALLNQLRIPWMDLPSAERPLQTALERADDHLRREERPFAFVVRKGTLGPSANRTTDSRRPPAAACSAVPATFADAVNAADDSRDRPVRADALRLVIDATPVESTVVVATTGYTGRELFGIADRPNHFYMVGSMGCASSLGLGLARARPDLRVVVIDGDGAALMRMGNLATIGASGATNLVHVLLDNGVHDSTGGQATVSGSMAFGAVAAACGYAVHGGRGLEPIERALTERDGQAPRFAHVRIQRDPAARPPRPTVSPHVVRKRLMEHIGSASCFC